MIPHPRKSPRLFALWVYLPDMMGAAALFALLWLGLIFTP